MFKNTLKTLLLLVATTGFTYAKDDVKTTLEYEKDLYVYFDTEKRSGQTNVETLKNKGVDTDFVIRREPSVSYNFELINDFSSNENGSYDLRQFFVFSKKEKESDKLTSYRNVYLIDSQNPSKKMTLDLNDKKNVIETDAEYFISYDFFKNVRIEKHAVANVTNHGDGFVMREEQITTSSYFVESVQADGMLIKKSNFKNIIDGQVQFFDMHNFNMFEPFKDRLVVDFENNYDFVKIKTNKSKLAVSRFDYVKGDVSVLFYDKSLMNKKRSSFNMDANESSITLKEN